MRYQWGMGGYHSNYTIFFLLAFSWLSLPSRAATSSNWERDTPLPKGPRTCLGLTSIAVGLIYRTHWGLRWMLSSCAFQREYAVRRWASASRMPVGDCLQIVSEVSVVATLTSFSSMLYVSSILVPQNVPMKPWDP